MARTKWVSRTVVSSMVKCTMLNPEDKSTLEVTIPLSDDWTDKPIAKVVREIQKKVNPDTGCIHVTFSDGKTIPLFFVNVESVSLDAHLYSMTEEYFVAHAQKVSEPRFGAEAEED